jgi:hypothetical protein
MRRWRWFGGPMQKLKIVFADNSLEYDGDATFAEAKSLYDDFLTVVAMADKLIDLSKTLDDQQGDLAKTVDTHTPNP